MAYERFVRGRAAGQNLTATFNECIGRVFLSAALIAVAMLVIAQVAAAQTNLTLHGNHTAEAANLITRASSNRLLTVHVAFALRNQAALTELLSDLNNPASPQYHHWLTPAEFEARFGRTQAEVAAVREWLVNQGFQVVHESSRGVTSTGTVANAEGAFATTIAASSNGAVYGNVSDPQIPARFADVIRSIEGLDNTRHSQAFAARPPRDLGLSAEVAASPAAGGDRA